MDSIDEELSLIFFSLMKREVDKGNRQDMDIESHGQAKQLNLELP